MPSLKELPKYQWKDNLREITKKPLLKSTCVPCKARKVKMKLKKMKRRKK